MTSQQLHFQGGVKSKFNIHKVFFDHRGKAADSFREAQRGFSFRAENVGAATHPWGGTGTTKQNQCIKVLSSSSSSSFIKKHV